MQAGASDETMGVTAVRLYRKRSDVRPVRELPRSVSTVISGTA